MKRILDVVYLTSSFLGAVLIAANVGAQLLGYCLFLVSSIVAVFLLYRSDASRSLLIVNIMFALINLLGIFRA